MQIEVTNFRCWENKNISFPSKGLCLLNGKSGKGKSSIMNAIVYCITGKGKNISTFSKKNTKVTITIDNLRITRSKGPNRLIVSKINEEKEEKIYEDTEAQQVIDSVFGSEFCNTSYIDQDNINSFVFLSPSEKIEFLENLLLSQYDIEKMKTTIKESISTTRTEYTTYESKVNTLQDLLKGMKYTEPSPLKIEKVTVSSENFQKIKEKLKTNLEVSEKNMKIISTKIKKYEEEQKKYNESFTQQKILEHSKQKLETQFDKNDLSSLQEKIKEMEDKKESYLSNKQYSDMLKKRKEIQEKLLSIQTKNKEKIEKLERELPECPDKKYISSLSTSKDLLINIFDLDERIKENTIDESVYDTQKKLLSSYSSQLSSDQKELSELDQCYTCPSCQNTLSFQNKTLVMFTNSADSSLLKQRIKENSRNIDLIAKNISEMTKKQTLFERYTDEYNKKFDQLEVILSSNQIEQDPDWIEEKIKEMEEKLQKHTEISRAIKDIGNDRYLSDMKKELERIDQILSTLMKQSEPTITEDEYMILIENIGKNKESFTSLKKINDEYERVISQLNSLNINTEKDREQDISSEKEKYQTYVEKVETYRQYVIQIEQWLSIYEQCMKYKEMEASITDCVNKKNELSDRMRCLVKLRDHVKNAERKSITDFVDSLNQHAALYIEEFFPDEDINVTLKTTQETKTDKREKISLNFEVHYKQMNGDLSFLSGGEKDRVNLAFTLAFAELVDNRVLLLDECISSLDTETTNVVLEHLKEKYKGNLILLVSHQANLGFFDQVIDL